MKRIILLFGLLFAYFCLNTSFLFPQVIARDSIALIDLYHSTKGESWTNKENWLTDEPVSEWFGVTVENGRVVALQFGLGNNLRDSVPQSIGNLTELTEFNLNYNYITYIPETLGKLKNLRKFFLKSNQIRQIPDSMTDILSLEEIDVSMNLISHLPDSIGKLSRLRSLDASYNDIDSLPDSFNDLSGISLLNLTRNNFVQFPLVISNLKSLKILHFGQNPIQNIPPELFNLDSLTVLHLNENLLSEIPGEIGRSEKLNELQLQGNLIRTVPAEIGNLTSLNHLDLSYNLISYLPNEIGNLRNLKTFNLEYNRLSELTNAVGNLSSLNELKLQHNFLNSLPESFGELKQLSELNLDENFFLDSLPVQIGKLENLTLISFRENQLRYVKQDLFSKLASLKWVFLQNNFLENLPDFSNNYLLADLIVKENRLTFEDIEPLMKNKDLHFYYSPQDSILVKADTNQNQGAFVTLYVDVGGKHNIYKWLKEGREIPGADSQYLNITAPDSTGSGSYVCKVTNSEVPDLTLFSKEYKLSPAVVTNITSGSRGIPIEYSLEQNFPNPFNPSTQINYTVPVESRIILRVFSADGKLVRTLVDEYQSTGYKSVIWDGKNNSGENVSSGIYFYKLQTDNNYSINRKMLMLK